MSNVLNSLEEQHHEASRAPARAEIVGESGRVREVMRQIEMVARTDSTVLILGETGTGKELVAKSIHDRSARRVAPLVALNCAAIPAPLLESELFGHEKGAFTGAHARRAGRVELAEGGSLFLDEVGEMPLDVQSRLLRLLQERTFERLGSSSTLRANVRVVAATNRDLRTMCAARTFRADLYYRLNVFPIHLPPLRERREDIPLLTRHFVAQLARQMNKKVPSISATTMKSLMAYDWPGNIRELQNILERSVILMAGSELEVALPWTRPSVPVLNLPKPHVGSLADASRAHIVAALQRSNGVIAGPNGAAARLGLKRSTLLFRMNKLGIPHGAERRRYESESAPSDASVEGSWSDDSLEIVA